ncbi:hypothetical protein ACFWVP_34065 [Streptomyces sp. NPDC058637]|uniref:hypothetical protein n=1 Tax=Streptomyces sp. NPDC058637 TaxID=3346569 RepID=UPI0036589314
MPDREPPFVPGMDAAGVLNVATTLKLDRGQSHALTVLLPARSWVPCRPSPSFAVCSVWQRCW